MTIGRERSAAAQRTRKFLLALVHKDFWEEAYPGIPWPKPAMPIREMANRLLRHYPADYQIEKLAEKVPEDWG